MIQILPVNLQPKFWNRCEDRNRSSLTCIQGNLSWRWQKNATSATITKVIKGARAIEGTEEILAYRCWMAWIRLAFIDICLGLYMDFPGILVSNCSGSLPESTQNQHTHYVPDM